MTAQLHGWIGSEFRLQAVEVRTGSSRNSNTDRSSRRRPSPGRVRGAALRVGAAGATEPTTVGMDFSGPRVYYSNVYYDSSGVKPWSRSHSSGSRPHSPACARVYHSAPLPPAETITPARIRTPDEVLGGNRRSIVSASFCTVRRKRHDSQAIHHTRGKIPAEPTSRGRLSRRIHGVVAARRGTKRPGWRPTRSQNDLKRDQIPRPHPRCAGTAAATSGSGAGGAAASAA